MTDKDFKDTILERQPYMQKLAESLLGNPDDASDAVQDAVVNLWGKREEWRSINDLKAVCGTVVRRRCVDMLRKKKPAVPVEEEKLMLVEPVMDDRMEERYQLAMKLINKLPKRQQRVILMKYEEGMSNKEIEKAMNMSSTHVYATLSRAYKSLKEAIKRYKLE